MHHIRIVVSMWTRTQHYGFPQRKARMFCVAMSKKIMSANGQQSPNERPVGFDCEFVEPPPEKFIQSICPVCLQIIREPYQVTCCGKKFCKVCIKRIKYTKNACPTCTQKEFSSYSDKGLKQALYDLKVRCSHQREGCEWTGELGQLDDHLNKDPRPEKQQEGCQYVKVTCNKDCGYQMQRRAIKNHHNYYCPNRQFTCEHCHVYKATYNDVIQTHWPVCGSFPLSCPNKCSSTIQRQKIDSHVANECPLTTINCDFHHVGCTVKLPRQDMVEHIKTSFLTHISLLATNHTKQRDQITELIKITDEQQDKIRKLESENKQLKIKSHKLVLLAKTSPRVVNSRPLAPPIITMTNYQQHKRDNDNWFSPPLYTHPQGYKICLSVYANGWGTGEGTHVSVYVYFMKGEFDDTLKWPFRGSILFQLLDEVNGEDHVSHTVPYDDKVSGARITEGGRAPHGHGVNNFIAHSALRPTYLHNDTLFFQVYKVEIKKK